MLIHFNSSLINKLLTNYEVTNYEVLWQYLRKVWRKILRLFNIYRTRFSTGCSFIRPQRSSPEQLGKYGHNIQAWYRSEFELWLIVDTEWMLSKNLKKIKLDIYLLWSNIQNLNTWLCSASQRTRRIQLMMKSNKLQFWTLQNLII